MTIPVMALIVLLQVSWQSPGCSSSVGAPVHIHTSEPDSLPGWMIGPFEKLDAYNPCLVPQPDQVFHCPVRNEPVLWEVKDVFNPAVIVHNGMLRMLYRAEDSVGQYAGTSRLGLARSSDGVHFARNPEPVFYPDRDQMFNYEWEGGVEDPRIVRRSDGMYIMTYTAYDGNTARLCVASSRDLLNWTKHGLAFATQIDGKYADQWSKSGAIVSSYDTTGTITAARIGQMYWMYWGDKEMYAAKSTDCIRWTPVTDKQGALLPVMSYRPYLFDSDLVEPGPPAILTDAGILLIYNGRNYGTQLDSTIAEGTYSAGQVLFDLKDPTRILQRSDKPFFWPDKDYEISGQVNRVVFLQGLVRWRGQWLLYYGTADSKIAVARALL